ncbi:MAG: Do family serine endopeptidase [Proteobacteria bacterium]|nr:Do family serine endopeptidase [Pseudomonadota bacterium]
MKQLFLFFTLFISINCLAGLPTEVDGQRLPSLAPVLEKVTPAVVNIHSTSRQKFNNRSQSFYSWYYGLPNIPQERVTQSLGSGVIVDAKNGYILTNNHVIDDADDIQVSLQDGRSLTARLIGTDEGTDVAVIQIDAKNLSELKLVNSQGMRVGDFVIAVGNPFGLGQTVTSGIVSALGRTNLQGMGYQNFIQTDASINPGNSGGALVNLRGELVGINTAIYSPSGGNVGIGFAIPSSLAKRIMNQLIQFGQVRRGSIGVEVQDITANLARAFNLEKNSGVIITDVEPDSPAEYAGLQAGDIVTRLNDKAVNNQHDFDNLEGLFEINTPIEIVYTRNEKQKTTQTIINSFDRKEFDGVDLHLGLTGAHFINLPARLKSNYQGVLIDEIKRGSQAWKQGLRNGDLITSANKKEIVNLKQLKIILDKSRKTPILNVYRNYRNYLLVLE